MDSTVRKLKCICEGEERRCVRERQLKTNQTSAVSLFLSLSLVSFHTCQRNEEREGGEGEREKERRCGCVGISVGTRAPFFVLLFVVTCPARGKHSFGCFAHLCYTWLYISLKTHRSYPLAPDEDMLCYLCLIRCLAPVLRAFQRVVNAPLTSTLFPNMMIITPRVKKEHTH